MGDDAASGIARRLPIFLSRMLTRQDEQIKQLCIQIEACEGSIVMDGILEPHFGHVGSDWAESGANMAAVAVFAIDITQKWHFLSAKYKAELNKPLVYYKNYADDRQKAYDLLKKHMKVGI